MYAAAGGASLASRQARQKQKKTKLKNAQKATDLGHKTPQAKQFQNYTDPAIPRLSRVERGTLKPPTPSDRRHSTSNYTKEPHARARIRESPSISIPVQSTQPLTPCTLVQQQNHLPVHSSPSLHHHQSQLPQIFIPPDGEGKLERRCSFVRQVEEIGKHEQDVLDRCNHICNFEIKDKQWETQYYTEYEKDVFGSLEYPFSECSQGRAAWQERERGRRCSLSEEARQHRIKQTEAHHRWRKRNRIHDATYGGGSDDEDIFGVYHQSAAANALLYVGLGTTAIGSVIFFVGTGEKGFKTLELRLIGPTLIACGLLCCLIRVLLCAVPSTCFRKRKKTRLKSNACPHSSRYPLAPKYHDAPDSDYVPVDKTALLSKQKKKVSIVPPNHSLPSTSTSEFKEFKTSTTFSLEEEKKKLNIPQINLPELPSSEEHSRMSREDSIIELQNLDMTYDIQSVSSNDSDSITVIEPSEKQTSKLTRPREPGNFASASGNTAIVRGDATNASGNAATVRSNVASTSGNAATVRGNVASASGDAATVRGNVGNASGNAATVRGNGAGANGNVASASGNAAIVRGNVSSGSGNVSSVSGNDGRVCCNVAPHSDNIETCLSVVIERSDNSDSSDGLAASPPVSDTKKDSEHSDRHSGIVLSPLQLGQ